MNKAGYDQGSMAPKVDSYQRPSSAFAEMQPGKTTEYVARQDRMINAEASQVKRQDYKGRYS